MRCSLIRETCSAALDGEETSVPAAVVDDHLRTCSACRAYVARAEGLRAAVPELAPRVVAAARDERLMRPLWSSPVRVGIVMVAVAQLLLAVPGLLYGDDEGAPIHVAHEVGAWDLALAVGLLFAAWRPLRAVGMLPFVAALSVGLLLTAGVDVMHGRQPALTESTHLLELVGTALLWLLMSPRPRRLLRIV